MASLFTRNDTYYTEFFDATRTPSAKRISLRTKRKAEARQRLVEFERDWKDGIFDPWVDDSRTYKQNRQPEKPATLLEALTAFLDEKQREGRSKATVENYRTFCGGLIKRTGEKKPLRSLTSVVVEAYVQDESIAKASRGTRYRHVRAWLRWCERKGYVHQPATNSIAPPPKAERMPKAVREADLKAIEAAIRADYRDKLGRGEVKEGELVWMIPMIWFGLYSGLRSSELARLRWGHIDFERGLILIFEQKNGKEQTVPLTAPARRILERMVLGDAETFVFLAPSSDPYRRDVASFKRNFARKFKRFAEAAGIARRITPHGLRHGFCTILAEAGKSAPIIKEAARHADVATSMRYVHIANEVLKSELDEVFG